jgi:uncharacterized pyridoxal phosphate-containing UPF0001 family protein
MTDKWEENAQRYLVAHDWTRSRKQRKFMAEYVSLIHGVDSLKLLHEINKQAQKT